MRPLKIIWLCDFCNSEMKIYFKKTEYQEYAPWITELLILFQNIDNVELHVVSPNIYVNKDVTLKVKNIEYHFYKQKIFNINFLNILTNAYFTNFYYIKRKVNNIISMINPDLIHLHGAENPYYSAAILPQIGEHKILVTIQGFVRKSSGKGFFFNKRVKIEENILKKISNFGYRANFMPKFISKFNENANFYFHLYPLYKPKVEVNEIYLERNFRYDCIFYGRVCKDKGVEDLIRAICIVKNKIPQINALIIGSIDEIYKKELESLVFKTKTNTNIYFSNFIETHEMLYESLKEGRMCVLPTYNDILPFTITECMILKIPVISYDIDGVNDLNINNTLLLVECGSIEKLAEKIIFLLENPNLTNCQIKNAYNFIISKYDNKSIENQILSAYYQILS